MANFCITCCSTADVTEEKFKALDVKYVCFHFQLGENDYLDDLGKSVTPAELYKRMLAGEMSRTSQVTADTYEGLWEPILKEGKDVIHLTLSSGISGTYNSACIAQSELAEKYPDRKIYVVDSLNASSGFGLLVDKLCELRDAGKSIDEVYNWVCENKLRCHAWFFSTDLTFFIRGGRVSKASGLVGSVLKICPLLNIDFDGRLIPREKVQSKKRVTKRILEKMIEHAENGTEYSGKCFISHSECYEDAKALADLIEATFPKLNGKVEIYDIGATIGAHTGPGTVALFFWGDKRVD